MHAILIAGAALVGLPVLLHLIMKQEPKRVIFPAMRFLRMRQKTNQRKMRLRHFILLALRMLLIALFCLALYQPRVSSKSIGISAESPVAAIFIIDTSPSMGYVSQGTTRLQDAKKRAHDLLDQLPSNSRIAILDPNDPIGGWEQSVADAHKRIDRIAEPSGFAPPLTDALAVAYQMYKGNEGDAPDRPMPRLVALFSDRAMSSWEGRRVESLTKLRDTIPDPKPVHVYIDVGIDKPTNVGIVGLEMKPQMIAASGDVVFTVTIRAEGSDVTSAEVNCAIDDGTMSDRKEVSIPAGSQKPVTFTFRNLAPGFHNAVVTIRDDNLTADNKRSITFNVANKRKILTISDDPFDAIMWKLAHDRKKEFDCEVVKTDDVAELRGYEAVCLLSVADPTSIAGKLKAYLEGGGRVLIAPGRRVDKYADLDFLPAKLGEITNWQNDPDPKKSKGLAWSLETDQDLAHPMMSPFRDWRRRPDINIFKESGKTRAWSHYEVTGKHPDALVVATYDDGTEDIAKRRPAVLERNIGRGKVLLMTTRIDVQDQEDTGIPRWNDYWRTTGTSWYLVFPNVSMRYLAGSLDDAVFNFNTGQDVMVPLPPVDGQKRVITISGPSVSGRDATPTIADNQTEIHISKPLVNTPGEYRVRTMDEKFEHRFSLAIPGEESTLEKVPVETIEPLLGKDRIVSMSDAADLEQLRKATFDEPVELFPWLLILVIFFFTMEGFIANRFYRSRNQTTTV